MVASNWAPAIIAIENGVALPPKRWTWATANVGGARRWPRPDRGRFARRAALGAGNVVPMAVCCWTSPLHATVLVVAAALAGCSTSSPAQLEASPSRGAPPPAVSGVDHTLTVRWSLADSFDILPDGSCAGRDENRGMGSGARIQLQGDSTTDSLTRLGSPRKLTAKYSAGKSGSLTTACTALYRPSLILQCPTLPAIPSSFPDADPHRPPRKTWRHTVWKAEPPLGMAPTPSAPKGAQAA